MVDRKLTKWLRKKHKVGYRKSVAKLNLIKQANPELFYHWKMGYCWSITRITRAVWQETFTYSSVRGLGVKLPLVYSSVALFWLRLCCNQNTWSKKQPPKPPFIKLIMFHIFTEHEGSSPVSYLHEDMRERNNGWKHKSETIGVWSVLLP